jgi:DNA-binding HxlR family transcriptional regulator
MAQTHTFDSGRKPGAAQGLNERRLEEDCPFAVTLRVLGRRWRPAIVWKVADGVVSFGGLKRALHGVTDMALSRELAVLQAAGLLNRTETARGRARSTAYALTNRGRSLLPLLAEMQRWGEMDRAALLDGTCAP